jgi:hypothetical protein
MLISFCIVLAWMKSILKAEDADSSCPRKFFSKPQNATNTNNPGSNATNSNNPGSKTTNSYNSGSSTSNGKEKAA